MPSQKRQFGDIGEKKAEEFLINNGYKIIDRNYRLKNIGEIDLIAERNRKLFFIEVKTRDIKHETNFPIGFSITTQKRQNLKKICQIYLSEKRLSTNEWQVDAIFVKIDFKNNSQIIEHLENVLWERYY